MSESPSSTPQYDAIVVGAGFTGLYVTYKLREKGMNVRGLEAGAGVGGTWYWNRYLGARTDSQSYVYQYWFSDELLEQWDWSERFPAQPETERYSISLPTNSICARNFNSARGSSPPISMNIRSVGS